MSVSVVFGGLAKRGFGTSRCGTCVHGVTFKGVKFIPNAVRLCGKNVLVTDNVVPTLWPIGGWGGVCNGDGGVGEDTDVYGVLS